MRDLTRYRIKTVQARTSEIQRLGKALESAGIKLGSVASEHNRQVGHGDDRGADRRGTPRRACWRTWRSAGCGPPGSWPTCRWRWPAGSPSITRCCAACTWTGSPCSTPRSPAWTSGSRPRPRRWQREADLLTSVPGFGDVVAQAWLAEIGPAPHLHFASHEKLASWVTLVPGEQHQRPQAQARPDRGRRDLHQADAGAGRLGRDPGPGPAAGPVQPAGPPLRRGQEPGREEEGDHRDRAHPAQDRLPGPQERDALPGPGRGLLHPARITRSRSRPAWSASCKSSTPAAPSPSPSARRRPPYHPALNHQP